MAEPSEENANHSFSFGIHPASTLKHSIKALSDANFNEDGMGVIKVGQKTVEITVVNSKTSVIGYLRFKVSHLINFRYRHPFLKKMINLDQISDCLSSAADDDTISIHHVHRSDELCFTFGDVSDRNFTVKLGEISRFILPIPDIIYACEAAVLSQILRVIIQKLEADELKQVQLVITGTGITIIVGSNRWNFFYDKKIGVRGMDSKQIHRASFFWPHCESLRKASYVAKVVVLCPVTDPPNCMMLRFNFQQLGDLVYIIGQTVVETNSQLPPKTHGESNEQNGECKKKDQTTCSQ